MRVRKMFSEVGELHKTAPHLLADLAELIVLFQFEQFEQLSQSSFESFIQTGVVSIEEVGSVASDGLASSAEISEMAASYIDDLWSHLRYRQKIFSDTYPFELNDGLLIVKPTLDKKNLIYIFLLICSRLRSFNNTNGFRQLMASLFTKFSAEVMRGILPDTGVVKIYDWGSQDRKTYFGTKNRDGLFKLAEFIGAEPIDNNISQESDSGDSEIDLVGVISFSQDTAKGYFVLIGQCASQEANWPSKTFEAHPKKLSALFHTPCDPLNVFFAPIFYRDLRGEWIQTRKVCGPVFIDRKRAIQQLIKSNGIDEVCSSSWFQDFVARVFPAYSSLLVP